MGIPRSSDTRPTMSPSAAFEFSDQVVVVLGMQSQVARSYTRFFQSKGAIVVLGNADNGSPKPPKRGDYISANVNTLGESVIGHAVKTYGRLDVLLVCGVAPPINRSHIDDACSWKNLIEGQLKTAFRSVRAAWPQFKAQKAGRIIFTADSHGAPTEPLRPRSCMDCGVFQRRLALRG